MEPAIKKLCECGCGLPTELVKQTDPKRGMIKGEPNRFLVGHSGVKKVTHGDCKSPEYAAWCHMVSRCSNPKDREWHNYGGRGISVCNEWRDSYESFLADVGRRPSRLHSLDRYPNNNGNYEPGNVRWATDKEQTRNKRTTKLITYSGQILCLKDWAKKLGVSYQYLQYRLKIGSFPGPKANLDNLTKGA